MPPTGRTFADEWTDADTAGQRAMLIEAGVRLDVQCGGWRKLDTSRVDFTMTGELDPAAEVVPVAADTEAEANGTDVPPMPGAVAQLAETTAVHPAQNRAIANPTNSAAETTPRAM
ncbi:hypothetical protein M2271_002427 [Streptomyces sp. LBL]|nr:hypothetical protein [Streptomyces sp. LBL]